MCTSQRRRRRRRWQQAECGREEVLTDSYMIHVSMSDIMRATLQSQISSSDSKTQVPVLRPIHESRRPMPRHETPALLLLELHENVCVWCDSHAAKGFG